MRLSKGGKFEEVTGTSYAAPIIVGAACLVGEKYPDWSALQIKHHLLNTAQPVLGMPYFCKPFPVLVWQRKTGMDAEALSQRVFQEYYGAGFIDIEKALEN